MSIDPVKIPQNVYIEDRIVGPLTLRQTIIMTLGGGFSYAIYATMQKATGHVDLVSTIIAWTPAAITALFALIKVNDLTLMKICFLLIEKMNKAPIRTFGPRRGITINIRTSAAPKEEDPAKVEQRNREAEKNRTSIRELSSIVDRTMPEGISAAQAEEQTAPVAETDTEAAVPVREAPRAVDPGKIAVDGTPPRVQGGPATFSDLSVFRDVFSPKAQ